MKRTPLKKKSKQEISVIQRKLWEIIKQIVRIKYPPTCYTCGRTGLSGSNCQTGHLWPKAALGAFLKYDLRVLRIQCYHCNINLGGNGAQFYSNMLEEIGKEAMDQLVRDRQVSVKAYDWYVKLTSDYQLILEKLNHEQRDILL